MEMKSRMNGAGSDGDESVVGRSCQRECGEDVVLVQPQRDE